MPHTWFVCASLVVLRSWVVFNGGGSALSLSHKFQFFKIRNQALYVFSTSHYHTSLTLNLVKIFWVLNFFLSYWKIISYILWRIISSNTANSIILWMYSWEAGVLGGWGTVESFHCHRCFGRQQHCHLMVPRAQMEGSNDNSSQFDLSERSLRPAMLSIWGPRTFSKSS